MVRAIQIFKSWKTIKTTYESDLEKGSAPRSAKPHLQSEPAPRPLFKRYNTLELRLPREKVFGKCAKQPRIKPQSMDMKKRKRAAPLPSGISLNILNRLDRFALQRMKARLNRPSHPMEQKQIQWLGLRRSAKRRLKEKV